MLTASLVVVCLRPIFENHRRSTSQVIMWAGQQWVEVIL